MHCTECGQVMNHDEGVVIGRAEVICVECALAHTDLYFPDYRVKRHLRGF